MDTTPEQVDPDEEMRSLAGKLHARSMSDWETRKKSHAGGGDDDDAAEEDSDDDEEAKLHQRSAAARKTATEDIRIKEAMAKFDAETGQTRKTADDLLGSDKAQSVAEAVQYDFLSGPLGLGWWAQSTQVRGLGVSMEAPESYGAEDVIGIVVDGVNQLVSFYKNRNFCFSVPNVISNLVPNRVKFLPAVTMVSGCVVTSDVSYNRHTLVYADLIMKNRAEGGQISQNDTTRSGSKAGNSSGKKSAGPKNKSKKGEEDDKTEQDGSEAQRTAEEDEEDEGEIRFD